VTGFVVNNIEQAVEAARRVRDLSRARCRAVFEKRFTANRMANDYMDVYTRPADSRTRGVEQSLESSMRPDRFVARRARHYASAIFSNQA
jgi:hypothetical protein